MASSDLNKFSDSLDGLSEARHMHRALKKMITLLMNYFIITFFNFFLDIIYDCDLIIFLSSSIFDFISLFFE